jgi:N-acetylneuraminic acid mutarotase
VFALLILIALAVAGRPHLAAADSSGSWTAVGSMTSARYIAQATLLTDGRVLVTGGLGADSTTTLASAELYDPGTDSWSAAGTMTTPRSRHVAVRLADGRVLVAGGRLAGNSLNSAELYDPATNRWSATGSMITPRDNFAAVRLPDGRVLVAGGIDATAAPPRQSPKVTDTAELYDPATGTWTQTGHMLVPRFGESMTLLSDGRVLVAGGNLSGGDQVQTRGAEIYDPASGRWTQTGNLNVARSFFSATLLADGRVLAAGGITEPSESVTATAEIFDPATGKWSLTGSMHVARAGFGAARQSVRLADGRVLVEGDALTDADSASAELYDPSTGTWSFTGNLTTSRSAAATVELADGRVLIVGGNAGGLAGPYPPVVLANAEMYTP